MDNFRLDLTGESIETLKEGLSIAFRHNAPGGRTTHWAEVEVKTLPEWDGASGTRKALVLLWHEDTSLKSQAFPTRLENQKVVEIVLEWLKGADYGPEPDHDGSNGRGFRLFCDHWGHVAGSHYGIIGIAPAWAQWGK